jgi:predicted outer membrane lipoprotein
MNKPETFEPAAARKQEWRALLATLAPAIAGIGSVVLATVLQQTLFSDLENYPLTIFLFVWLFGTMMWCAFSVVRHAEAVASRNTIWRERGPFSW